MRIKANNKKKNGKLFTATKTMPRSARKRSYQFVDAMWRHGSSSIYTAAFKAAVEYPT